MVSKRDETQTSNRVVMFRDLTEGRAAKILQALDAADPSFAYRSASSIDRATTEVLAPAAVVFHVASDMPNMAEALFREVEACSRLTKAPISVLTDSHDLAFYMQCYDRGIRGVLPTSMLATNAALALHFIAGGGTFLSAQMMLARHDL